MPEEEPYWWTLAQFAALVVLLAVLFLIYWLVDGLH